jgi:hypothetical protein
VTSKNFIKNPKRSKISKEFEQLCQKWLYGANSSEIIVLEAFSRES